MFDRVNPILAQGAAFAAVDDGRPLRGRRPDQLIRTGDGSVEPDKGLVTILNRD